MPLVVQSISSSKLVTGEEYTLAYTGSGWVSIRTVNGAVGVGANGPEVVRKSLSTLLSKRQWTEVVITDAGVDKEATRHKWHRFYNSIFRYFFCFEASERDLVHAFCAAVRNDWSSTVREGGVPSVWNEQQADSGEYLLDYDAQLNHAVQYGQEEPIAQRVDSFSQVEFAKILSPAIDWNGMELTDPTDDTKKTFTPGDLHLTDDTSLQDQIQTQVSRSDLIAHWGLSFP